MLRCSPLRANGKTSTVHHCWQGLPQPGHSVCCVLNVPLAGAVTSICCSSVCSGREEGRDSDSSITAIPCLTVPSQRHALQHSLLEQFQFIPEHRAQGGGGTAVTGRDAWGIPEGSDESVGLGVVP